MTITENSGRTRGERAPLVRRVLTCEGGNGFDLVQWAKRSVQINEPDGTVAFACENVEAPVGWSNLAVAVVARRYFATDAAGRSERSVRTLLGRVLGAIASWALESGHVADAVERATLFDELAALVLTQRATFATPVWLNTGLDERPLTSTCRGLDPATARVERRSAQRANGRARRGAKMVVLDASHPDVFEFIEAKAREEGRGRALLAAGYPFDDVLSSLPFQHATHSVRVSDEFMRQAVEGGQWSLRTVTTSEVLETFPARRLLCACAEAAARCGDPGLQFAGQVARWHTCPNSGPITASNPCGEFLHVGDSACNLATLNLRAFVDGRRFDVDAFTAAVELLVIAQDAIVDGSGYPSERIDQNDRAPQRVRPRPRPPDRCSRPARW